MRRILPVLMMVLILFGCAPREYETVRDVIPAGDPADAPCEIRVEVPAEAAAPEAAEAAVVGKSQQ